MYTIGFEVFGSIALLLGHTSGVESLCLGLQI